MMLTFGQSQNLQKIRSKMRILFSVILAAAMQTTTAVIAAMKIQKYFSKVRKRPFQMLVLSIIFVIDIFTVQMDNLNTALSQSALSMKAIVMKIVYKYVLST